MMVTLVVSYSYGAKILLDDFVLTLLTASTSEPMNMSRESKA